MSSNRIHPDKLEPGDHLCVRRYGMVYSHHGIYSGDRKVIHYTDIQGLMNKRVSRVVETSLEEFLGSGILRRRKHVNSAHPDTILERARAGLNEAAYHLVFNNCEHFATWCATGRKKSPQVRRAVTAVAFAASTFTLAAGAVLSRVGRRPRA